MVPRGGHAGPPGNPREMMSRGLPPSESVPRPGFSAHRGGPGDSFQPGSQSALAAAHRKPRYVQLVFISSQAECVEVWCPWCA